MLLPWTAAPLTKAVARALRAAPEGRPVFVLGDGRLAQALAETGYRVVRAGGDPSPRRRHAPDAICDEKRLPVASSTLSAVVGWAAGDREDWQELLAEWVRAVAPSGVVVLVDALSVSRLRPGLGASSGHARASELTRRALCAGLTDIEQRRAGRRMVTSGAVAAALKLEGVDRAPVADPSPELALRRG